MNNGIVIITTPGTLKETFVNILQERTAGKVVLVIQQKKKHKKIFKRLATFYKKVGFMGLSREIYFILHMVLRKRLREALNYTKLYTPMKTTASISKPPILEVDDINSDAVYQRLCVLQPKIIAIWGGSIIAERVIKTAQYVFNVHTGYCPYYRGTNCHLHAILNDDLSRIGTTIHSVVPAVDAGPIHRIVTTDTSTSPRVFFRKLNDAALSAYVQIVLDCMNGNMANGTPQDISLGKNYLLKEWTYEKRYRVAKKIIALEKPH